MHHCLLIPELALAVIHFLADDRPAWHDSRYLRNSRDVARLARTCRALSEPALDVLWRTQHSLSPLVMCLPPDVWELTKRGKSISFKRDPTPSDWAPVLKYALRVRSISQPASFSLPRLDDAALAALMTPSNFGTLFPSLSTLDYSVISVAAPMIHLLTNVLATERHLESISSLSVICPRASQRHEVYDLFQAIRTKATRLETLRIESFTSASSNPSLAVKLVQGEFKYLRKLDLSWTIHVSIECMACLAGIEYLQELSLYMRRDIALEFLENGCSLVGIKGCTDDGEPPPLTQRTFPALRSLKVMAYSLDQCTALLSLVTSPLLDNIVFSYDVQAPSALIETFFRQVQKTCQGTTSKAAASNAHTLRYRTVSLTLKHNLGPFTSAASPFLIHPSQTLLPLLALPHLRTLRLLHLGTIAIDDAFLREAARAWGAHLYELEECGIPWVGVEECREIPGFVSATLDGIGAFVRMCPRLEKLRVAFDGRCLTAGTMESGSGLESEAQDVGAEPRAGARTAWTAQSQLGPEEDEGKDENVGEEDSQDTEDGDPDVDAIVEAGLSLSLYADASVRAESGRRREERERRVRTCSSLLLSSPALQVLNVRDSPIDDPECVADFLKQVAPALRVICVEGSLDMWRKWREVEDRMKLTGPV